MIDRGGLFSRAGRGLFRRAQYDEYGNMMMVEDYSVE